MVMPPGIRKFALTAHVMASVGWLGGVAAYLAVALVAVTSAEGATVRAMYLALEPITRFVLVPFAMAALVTGLAQSLGTVWGLFRHYWVVFKLVLTAASTVILLGYTRTVGQMAELAADPATEVAQLRSLGAGISHASAAMVVLLATVVLSVYKPRGLTPYGWRRQRTQRRLRQTGEPAAERDDP